MASHGGVGAGRPLPMRARKRALHMPCAHGGGFAFSSFFPAPNQSDPFRCRALLRFGFGAKFEQDCHRRLSGPCVYAAFCFGHLDGKESPLAEARRGRFWCASPSDLLLWSWIELVLVLRAFLATALRRNSRSRARTPHRAACERARYVFGRTFCEMHVWISTAALACAQ